MKARTALRSARKPSLLRARVNPPASRTTHHASLITHHASRLTIRLLTAVPICDGHDSAINTINLEFIRHGIEVIYLGYHRSAGDIVRAAIQEDVRAIGLSSYNGGHIEFFAEVIDLLKNQGARDIGIFGGGGGTITPADARIMEHNGGDRIFFPGTPLTEVVEFANETYGRRRRCAVPPVPKTRPLSARQISKLLTAVESGSSRVRQHASCSTPVIGITGPGGAGKTTLIDELVLRFLGTNAKARLAILSHDPSLVGRGALLGDRATMIYSQDDRVFMRSLATRGRAGGLSPATEPCLELLKRSGFDPVVG